MIVFPHMLPVQARNICFGSARGAISQLSNMFHVNLARKTFCANKRPHVENHPAWNDIIHGRKKFRCLLVVFFCSLLCGGRVNEMVLRTARPNKTHFFIFGLNPSLNEISYFIFGAPTLQLLSHINKFSSAPLNINTPVV